MRNKVFGFFFLISIVGLGKILGFFKDLSLSYYLGANGTTDAYFVSVYAAGLLYGGIYSAIPLVIVPNASESDFYTRNQEITISSMAILSTTMVLSVAVFYFSDIVACLFLPESTDETVASASYFIRIAAVTFPLSALTLIATSVRLADGEKVPSNAIAIFNSSLFIGAVYVWHSPENFKIALYSTIFSWLLMLLLYGKSIIFLHRYFGCSVRKLSSDRFFDLFRSAKMFYLDQVTPALALYFAAQAGDSFVSLFSYSNKLFLLYTTFFVVFINSFLVPRFAKNYVSGMNSFSDFNSDFTKLMIIVFPMTLFTLFNSEFLATLVFDRGEITQKQLKIIAALFSILALAIPFMVIKDVFVKLILINKDPVPLGFIHLGALLFNVIFCIILVPRLSIVAVALGYFLATLLVAFILIFVGRSGLWSTSRSKALFLLFSTLIFALSIFDLSGIYLDLFGGLDLFLISGSILAVWYVFVLKRFFQISLLKF